MGDTGESGRAQLFYLPGVQEGHHLSDAVLTHCGLGGSAEAFTLFSEPPPRLWEKNQEQRKAVTRWNKSPSENHSCYGHGPLTSGVNLCQWFSTVGVSGGPTSFFVCETNSDERQ